MLSTLLRIVGCTALFSGVDHVLTERLHLDGTYYFLHSLHNAAIVYLTWPDVVGVLTDFPSTGLAPYSPYSLELVFALHFYHIAMYWRKFRYDDWLHHILMIGVALPIGVYVTPNKLLGFSLFFTTGLPGGIDYALLTLVRNGLLERNAEKGANAWLNVWVRSPGCVAQAALGFAYLSMQGIAYTHVWYLVLCSLWLNYWNGQYFMRQVVENAALHPS